MTTLAELRPGQEATIRGIGGEAVMAQRMLELGLIEGSPVKVVRFAPAGDPMEVEVMGYTLSLRKSEAAAVEVDDVR